MKSHKDISRPAGNKPRITVIEDDPDTRELIAAFFQPKGYEIIPYEDAAKALTDMEADQLACEVIITDLMLPSISGIEFTKSLRERGCNIPIILITANKTVETALEAIDAGAYDFVVKPLHFPQLLVSVARALHLNRITSENFTLKTVVQMQEEAPVRGIIGKSPGFLSALDLARRVSSSNANILITGESGSGKEVIARAIHDLGQRRKKPFVAINCSSIPENLLESELFGHTRGAFTGASESKHGLFEEAEGGTLFLDEIGDLSLPLQAKLLRVLQEKKIKRIGENQLRNVDVRILSATHKDLRAEVTERHFREDLFFRLNVIQIKIPPLRERKEDIVPLAEFFLKKFVAINGSPVKGFSKGALERLLNYNWPGNVREIENTIERAVVLCSNELIDIEDVRQEENAQIPAEGTPPDPNMQFLGLPLEKILTVDEMVKRYIKFVLSKNNGAKERTARDLDIDRKTLYRKIHEIESSNLSDF